MAKVYQAMKQAGVWVVDNTRQRGVAATMGTGLMLAGQAAHAALPASVGTTITAIQADGQAVFDLVFPVVGVFIGLAVVIKLFKRFSNKV